jgi:hypothetical protein
LGDFRWPSSSKVKKYMIGISKSRISRAELSRFGFKRYH